MEPKIITKPAFKVVGMKYRGANQHNEIPQLWNKFGPHMHEVRHAKNPDTSYGVMDNYDRVSGEFDYIAAVEVENSTEDSASPEEGMVTKTIPAQTYVVFPCSLSTIAQTYDKIYHKWMPDAGYRRAEGPEFERYDEDFEPGNPNSEMDLYIPIEPAL